MLDDKSLTMDTVCRLGIFLYLTLLVLGNKGKCILKESEWSFQSASLVNY